MKPEYVELWERIKHFELDLPGVEFPFSARLAKENEWSREFSERVIEEYRRFAFLAVVAGHPASPSDTVDQVWHLHLTCTKSYWKEFCGEVLGMPLHHHPTEGGAKESAKFDDWYRRTLESYREYFGEAPPRDIWPLAEEKLASHHRFARVDKATHWVIPKPRFPRIVRLAFLAAVAGMAAVGCGAMIGNGANPLDWRGPEFLRFYSLVLPVCIAAAAWLRWKLREPSETRNETDTNLDAYAVAFLNQGKVLAVNTAMTSLIDRKILEAEPSEGKISAKAPLPPESHPLEKAVYDAVTPAGEKIAEVRRAARWALERISEQLKRKGLAVNDAQARMVVGWPLMLAAIPPVLGAIKVAIGISRGRPVGYLAAACVVSAILALAGFARRPLRTRAGDALLRRLQSARTHLFRCSRHLLLEPAELAMAMGLFGMAALAGTPYEDLRRTLQPPVPDGGGCGGGGCGGSGCGGGCGGCGGGD
jgi:uncharacterized protein (TIGR04222 family)